MRCWSPSVLKASFHHGTYKGGPEGFTYHGEEDHYVCPQGKTIPFTKVFNDYRTGTKKKEYRASKKVCAGCPIREQCLGRNAQEKKLSVTTSGRSTSVTSNGWEVHREGK